MIKEWANDVIGKESKDISISTDAHPSKSLALKAFQDQRERIDEEMPGIKILSQKITCINNGKGLVASAKGCYFPSEHNEWVYSSEGLDVYIASLEVPPLNEEKNESIS